MRTGVIILLYLMSFLSGGAALMYEVVWFRSLSLIFGGTHLAVTTTVSVFMAGLALGSWLAGKKLVRCRNLLAVYALLELGIGLSALCFLAILDIYPRIYVPLARIVPELPLSLTLIRVVFATFSMIVPTTLMGATLPVLTGMAASGSTNVAPRLSFLYGFNTLGAVTGTTVTGFYLLTEIPVSQVVYLAAAVNLGVALISWLGRGWAVSVPREGEEEPAPASTTAGGDRAAVPMPCRQSGLLILVAIGLSGFCALGYEVLWTRVLLVFVDGSVYGFTTMLVAFLMGIGLGGLSYAILRRVLEGKSTSPAAQDRRALSGFAVNQILIGLATLVAMNCIFSIPAYWIALQKLFFRMTGQIFSAQQFGNFFLEFSFLFVPAFFMGLAIPLAVKVHSRNYSNGGQVAGEVLASNTIGSILGGAISGFVLIYCFGIEGSLYLLIAGNICLGLLLIAITRNWRPLLGAVPTAFIALLVILATDAGSLRNWDTKYLGTYTQTTAPYFADPAQARSYLDGLEVNYYAEGVESIVSTVHEKSSGLLWFSTNGRIEASTRFEDVQLQYLLGHLPMLLHERPAKVLNIGMGSGMSLGALSVHPEVERITLAEIEPKVIGVARSFGDWNHNVADNPKLEIVFNDARNYLLTTEEKFDVIAMDPLQPYWRGSGYLYTTEYFKLVAEHLEPGGLTCQYLPLYHLSVDNMKSIIRSFRENFQHVLLWVSISDIEMIGSNDPIVLDEQRIASRLAANPTIRADLEKIMMGSADELFTYFLMGNEGVDGFAGNARLNTDDNVYIEFSSPRTIGDNSIESKNLAALAAYRERIDPYLAPAGHDMAAVIRMARFTADQDLHQIADQGQIMYLTRYPTREQILDFKPQLDKLPDFGRWGAVKATLAAGLNL